MLHHVRINFVLNGVPVQADIDPRASLAEVLRDTYGCMSVKCGCQVGECGACTVLIDGTPYNSCIYLALHAQGRTIHTVEGLSNQHVLSDLQQAFVDEAAVQCGFCTPGMLLAAAALLQHDKVYTRQEIRAALSGNFCRCTGYENIIRAIECVQEKRRQQYCHEKN